HKFTGTHTHILSSPLYLSLSLSHSHTLSHTHLNTCSHTHTQSSPRGSGGGWMFGCLLQAVSHLLLDVVISSTRLLGNCHQGSGQRCFDCSALCFIKFPRWSLS